MWQSPLAKWLDDFFGIVLLLYCNKFSNYKFLIYKTIQSTFKAWAEAKANTSTIKWPCLWQTYWTTDILFRWKNGTGLVCEGDLWFMWSLWSHPPTNVSSEFTDTWWHIGWWELSLPSSAAKSVSLSVASVWKWLSNHKNRWDEAKYSTKQTGRIRQNTVKYTLQHTLHDVTY